MCNSISQRVSKVKDEENEKEAKVEKEEDQDWLAD